MANTTFVDRVTTIATAWLQDVNNYIYGTGKGAPLNFYQFGAVGDGTADDTTAVQACINYAALNNRGIVQNGGTFGLTTALVIPASTNTNMGVSITGIGGATFEALPGFSTILVAGIYNGVMCHVTGSNVLIENMIFDANQIATVPMVGVWADTTANYLNVINSEFSNFYYYGGGFISCAVVFRQNSDSRIEGCTFKHVPAAYTTQGGNYNTFNENIYIGNTTGTRDTAFGMDGGIGCQITNNTMNFSNGTGTISSTIGVTSGATSFLVSGNQIIGQNNSVSIYVWGAGGANPSDGIISNNIFDNTGVTATATIVPIRVATACSNVTVEDNTILGNATGFGSSLGIDVGTAGIVVRNNTLRMIGLNAGISFTPTPTTGGYAVIEGNTIDTNSSCVLALGGATSNQGKSVWIKNNTFQNAAYGVNCTSVVESTCPVYMEDNIYQNMSSGVTGTRWDVGFNSGGAKNAPHYCGITTRMTCAAIPDGSWTTGGGSFAVGDTFWNSAAVAGSQAGWICTTGGVAGSAAVFTPLESQSSYTSASTACTGAVTASVIWKVARTGRMVTLSLPDTQSAGVAVTSFVYGVVLPTEYRPVGANQNVLAAIIDNAAALTSPGSVVVGTNGVITVYKTIPGATAFTVSATAGIAATSFSWVV